MKNNKLLTNNNSNDNIATEYKNLNGGNYVNPLFNKPLPVKNKKEFDKKLVYLTPYQFNDFDVFKYRITSNIKSNTRYTCFVKLTINEGSYLMAGNQFLFCHINNDDLIDLQQVISIKISELINKYEFEDIFVKLIQVNFITVSKLLISEFSKDENIKALRKDITREHLTIPLSIYRESLGEPLKKALNSKGELVKITSFNNKGETIDLFSLIKEKNNSKLLKLDNNYDFYYMNYNIPCILAIKIINENSVYKVKFSLSGIFISDVTDRVVKDNNIIRTSGSKVTTFKDCKD